MTRVFLETGEVVPVTIISCPANIVNQVKTLEKDGYSAVCLAVFPRKKPTKMKTHYFKKEIKTEGGVELKRGDLVTLADLAEGANVQIIAQAKGKGFQGVMKRHNFAGGPATHGSKFHRQPGSMGNCKPSRSIKGMKMAGRMGGQQLTLKSVPIVKIDVEKGLIALKGSIPGGRNSFVTIIAK